MSAGRPVYYIQLYNQQHDPVFMELSTGKLLWTLPHENVLTNVLFVTHISDDGRFYFENVDTNQVAWELPKSKMGMTAADTAELVIKASRKVLEKRVGTSFDADKSNLQMLSLDSFLRSKDELHQQQQESGARNTQNQATSGNSFLQAALGDDSDEEEGYSPLNPNKNPFVQSGAASSDEDDHPHHRSTVSARSSLKTVEMIRKNAIKSGYLMKLATVSGRNWKKRFFTVSPYFLAYYEDETSAMNVQKKPKGELQIVPDGIVQEEKVDKKYGYGFKYITSVESIVLAASSEIDRAHWMQTLEVAIQTSTHHLKAFLTILPFSTVFQNQNVKNYFGANQKVPARKYCILTEDLLSVHPDKQTTTTIDAVINITDMTKIDCVEQAGTYIIHLTDSDSKASKISLQFNNGVDDDKFFTLWKNRLMGLIFGGDPTAFVNRPSTMTKSSSANKNNTDKASEGNRPVSVKQAIPSNAAVFGLSLDDDDDDEEDAGAGLGHNINDDTQSEGREAKTTVPFSKPPLMRGKGESDPSSEAKTTASTAAAKRPSKPLGKSYLKMRSRSQSKERVSTTSITATASGNESSGGSSVTANPMLKVPSAGSASSSVFGLDYEDDDDEDNEGGGSATVDRNSAVSQPNPASSTPPPPPPPPPPKKTVEVDDVPTSAPVPTFDPMAATRRRSVLQPPAMTTNQPPAPPPQSLFLQSLKAKNDSSSTGVVSQAGLMDRTGSPMSATAGNKSPQPPLSKMSTETGQSWDHPHSLHDFPSPVGEDSRPVSIRRRSGVESAQSAFTTRTVNALDYPMDAIQDSAAQPLQFQPFVGNSTAATRRASRQENNSAAFNQLTRSIDDLTLQEYLTTPIELRSSKQLEELFAKPVDQFLQQTNQILWQSKEKLKQLIAENHQLLPIVSNHSAALRQEKQKTSFSLEKIEQYLQSHSIFQGSETNASQQQSYQQLLQEKEIILNLLQFMKLSEQSMMEMIQTYEAEALQQIQQESSFYKQELLQFEQELKNMHQQHYREIQEHNERMNRMKEVMFFKYQDLQKSYEENLGALMGIAKDLNHHQQQMMNDRKKMLKQRYQLDVLLQDINDVQGGMNAPSSYSSPIGNMTMMNPQGGPTMMNQHQPAMMNQMLNYSTDSLLTHSGGMHPHQFHPTQAMMMQQQQLQQRNAAQMMSANNGGNTSPVMMSDYFTPSGSGGYPYGGAMMNNNSHYPVNAMMNRANIPARSQSPNGNRILANSGNLSAAQAVAMHYTSGNRSSSPIGYGNNVNFNDAMFDGVPPPPPPLPNEEMMHVDELADYRVGRSRMVQPNNVNAVTNNNNMINRTRSRSPASSSTQANLSQSSLPLRNSGNLNLSKQQLLQAQMMKQQQQQQTYGTVMGNNTANPINPTPSSSSRGTSPSPYYLGNTPAQIHNIQVNLDQIKKHTMNNGYRKPFK